MVGCNLRCGFCWVVDQKKVGCANCNIEKYPFQRPEETYEMLKTLAYKHNLRKLRVSGCETLLNERHIVKVIRQAMSDNFLFVLDTNGLLLTEDFLATIKPFRSRMYIYFGLKGSNPDFFQEVTKAEGRFWWKQLEAMRLIVKNGFTLGVNLIANLTSPSSLPTLFNRLYKISPILPMCVDMKPCTYFIHNTKRINRYDLRKFSPSLVKNVWDTMLSQKFGDDNNLVEMFQTGETAKAFDRYELKTLVKRIEYCDGLKFVKLPEIPFSIPCSKTSLSNRCNE